MVMTNQMRYFQIQIFLFQTCRISVGFKKRYSKKTFPSDFLYPDSDKSSYTNALFGELLITIQFIEIRFCDAILNCDV